MANLKITVLLEAAPLLASATAWADAGALGIDIFGLSYHTDQELARSKNVDNQVNPGLGLRYDLSESPRHYWFAEGDIYRDSGRRWAKIGGIGYQYKISDRLLAGGAAAFAQSATYNGGSPFLVPLPLVSYRFDAATFNLSYAPKVHKLNDTAVFGFYLTVPLGGRHAIAAAGAPAAQK